MIKADEKTEMNRSLIKSNIPSFQMMTDSSVPVFSNNKKGK